MGRPKATKGAGILIIEEMPEFMKMLSDITGRQFNDTQIDVWFSVLNGYTKADCITALYDHMAQSSGFLTPADVATRVKAIRMARVTAAGTPPNPPEYVDGEDWPAYQAMYLSWQAAWTENVANGVPPAAANQLALEKVGQRQSIEANIPYQNPLVLKGTETH